jgi:uncharacterized protein YjbJ (UPF0337 family)
MNLDSISGFYKNLKGLLIEKWGIVFHHQSAVRKGKEVQLLGSIQMRYGRTRDSAARNNRSEEQKATESH